jgi:hypothetical protein
MYHDAGGGIGLIKEEVGAGVKKTWGYDALGRAVNETLIVNGKTFSTDYIYNEFGELKETVYPNSVSMYNQYDNVGYLQNVAMAFSDVNDVDFSVWNDCQHPPLQKSALPV